jgi:glucose-6-phosphate 1-dehydrogenase
MGIAGVEHHSTNETVVALRGEIDNWRWVGLPFFAR